MIIQETKPSDRNWIKTWCKECAKTIVSYEGDEETGLLGQTLITVCNFEAERHEHYHPAHNITVTLYEKGVSNGQ